MKKLILCALMLAWLPWAGFCQTDTPADAPARNEWLPSFAAVEVAGAIDIELIRVPASEAPKIVYDTKGSYTTRFTFEVKNNVLRINERVDARRPDRTQVTLYYNTLESLSITDATATVRDTIDTRLFDLSVGARATLHATLDVQDLNMELTGRNSRATLQGSARYLTLYASTGTVDALELQVMAARINVTGGGSVFVDVTDRLEAQTSTNGRLSYKTEPAIRREATRFMGGDIATFKQN